jgi:hypothetical protein
MNADPDTLLRQSIMTAELYLERAVLFLRDREDLFGSLAPVDQRRLVEVFVLAAQRDYGDSLMAQKLQEGLESIALAISEHGKDT